MDEQRILEEMERMLAADDPKLAARLAAFGQPGFGRSLRTRRARAALSILMLVLIAAVAAVVYMMSAFRLGNATNNDQQAPGHHSAAPRMPGWKTVPASRPMPSYISAHCATSWKPACASEAAAP